MTKWHAAILTASLAAAPLVLAGCPSPGNVWFRDYDSQADSAAHAIASTTDGGYIVAGFTEPLDAEDNDIVLLKIDGAGGEQWSATLGDSRDDTAYDVEQTADGGYIVVGRFGGESDPESDGFLLKTDATGAELWRTLIDSEAEDFANTVVICPDGGYLVAAQLNVLEGPTAAIIKFDTTGDEVWRETIDDAFLAGLHTNPDETSVLIAWRLVSGDAKQAAPSGQLEALKVGSTGAEVWRETYDADVAIEARGVARGTGGGTAIVGQAGFLNDDSSLFLWAIDENGTEVFRQDYAQDGRETGFAVAATTTGYVIAGEANLPGLPAHALLMATDTAGVELWRKAYGEDLLDVFRDVLPLPNNAFIAAGHSESFLGANEQRHSEVFVVQTGPDGALPEIETDLTVPGEDDDPQP